MTTPREPVLDDWREHGEFLRRLARRLVDHHSAEDLAQDTWLATRSSGAARSRVRRSWLRRVIRNRALNLRRDRSRRAARERAAARPEAVSPDEVRARLELQSRIVALVGELEEPYRTTVYLRFYEDLPPREIAARQGLSVHTVKTRLQRALARLRASLDAGSAGGRRTWCAALLPLAAAARPIVHPVPPAALLGGITVKSILAVGIAAFAVLFGLIYLPSGPEPDSPSSRSTGTGAEPGQPATELAVGSDAVDLARNRLSATTPDPGPSPAPDWILAGRVTDPTGSPIAGARVAAAVMPSRAGVVTSTAGDGTYRLSLDLPDEVSPWASVGLSAEASAAGFSAQQRNRSNLRGSEGHGQELGIDFTLQPQRHARGTIVGARGEPAGGATVALLGAGGRVRASGHAGVDGTFLLPLDQGGPLWLAAGSAAAGSALTGPHDAPAEGDVDLGTTALRPHGVLEGTLTLPDGTPIAGTPVSATLSRADDSVGELLDRWLDQARAAEIPLPRAFAGNSSGATHTDDRGRFRLEGLAPGTYELEFLELGRPPARLRAGPYRTGEHAQVVLEAYRISVSVVDHQGLAVPGAGLTVRKGDGASVTSSRGLHGDGTFAVDPGSWVVTASLEGARPAEQTIEVVPGDYQYEVQLVLDFEPATGELQILVTDDRRQPVTTFEVNLWLQDSSVMVADFSELRPDPDGVLPPIPTGYYKVRVTFPVLPGRPPEAGRPVRLGDHFSVDSFATVQEGRRATLRLTTRRGGRLRLWLGPEGADRVPVSISLEDVLDGTTRRISGLTEQVSPEQSRYSSAVLGTAGFSNLLEPGTYVLRATAEGYRDFERTVDVRAGETTELRIQLERS